MTTMATELGYSQLPHYCTHAESAFRELAALLEAKGIPADMEHFLADGLKEAAKFLLPDNGMLFADHDYKPTMFELQKLPYPVCALEFTAGIELFAAESGLTHAAKRIALCFDPRKLPSGQQSRLTNLLCWDWPADFPENGLCVAAIFEAGGEWSVSPGIVLVDLDNDHPILMSEQGGLDSLAARVGNRLGNPNGTKHGLPATFLPFYQRTQLIGLSREEAAENVYIDTIDEMRVTFEFLAAINCANVGTRQITAPTMLNKKRVSKGKVPFYGYSVLDLAPASSGAGGTLTGSHAAPRTHLRRGHLRRLGDKFGNKVLWINATVVNPTAGALGAPVYKVKPPK